MARQLETTQHEQRNQRAYVQAVGGRVEAAIERARTVIQPTGQLRLAGNLENEAPGLQVL